EERRRARRREDRQRSGRRRRGHPRVPYWRDHDTPRRSRTLTAPRIAKRQSQRQRSSAARERTLTSSGPAASSAFIDVCYRPEKLTVTLIDVSIGTPSSCVAANCHWLTASIADADSSGCGDETICRLCT